MDRKRQIPLAKPNTGRRKKILEDLKKQTPKDFETDFETRKLSEKEIGTLKRMLPRMGSPKDPEKKSIDQKKKSKEGFEKFDREKRKRERQGDLYIESARKGGMMKDIMGDKKGRVIYKGKAKDYKMIIPIEPPSTPSEATSKMKKMKGGMVRVKTRLGRTKPTKIY